MSKVITLASGQLNGADQVTVQLIRPEHDPAIVRILWPLQPTVTDPKRFPEMAAMLARLFATASTELAAIKARRLL
jgi:hypothetical protein